MRKSFFIVLLLIIFAGLNVTVANGAQTQNSIQASQSSQFYNGISSFDSSERTFLASSSASYITEWKNAVSRLPDLAKYDFDLIRPGFHFPM